MKEGDGCCRTKAVDSIYNWGLLPSSEVCHNTYKILGKRNVGFVIHFNVKKKWNVSTSLKKIKITCN